MINGMVFGQQNMYWTFNESSTNCPLNIMTQTPGNLNITGSYTYTDICNTLTGTSTAGSQFVSITTAGNALQNYVPRPSSGTLSKNFIFQFSGSDLMKLSQFKIYFQFSRNSLNYNPQYTLAYSTNGTNYTTFATVTALPAVNTWREESFNLSAVSALNGLNLTNLFFRITYSHDRGSSNYTTTVAIDNFQVQATLSCANPTAYNISGGGSFCSGGPGIAVGLSNSETTVKYQLYREGTIPVGALVSGTGSAIGFGDQTTPGIYTIVATRTSGGCTSNMTGSATVIVNPLPSTSVTGQSNISCFDGNDGTITIHAGGGTGPYSYSVDNGENWIPSGTDPYPYGGLKANEPYKIRVKDINECTSKIIP
jgi:hypothetical protein